MLYALIFIHEKRDLQFKVDSELQIFEKFVMAVWFTFRAFARNLMKENRRINIFSYFIDWKAYTTLYSGGLTVGANSPLGVSAMKPVSRIYPLFWKDISNKPQCCSKATRFIIFKGKTILNFLTEQNDMSVRLSRLWMAKIVFELHFRKRYQNLRYFTQITVKVIKIK